MKRKIICTLGPATLKKKIIKKLLDKNVDILRYNLSHLNKKNLFSNLRNFEYLNKKICIDTEGAQVRTTKVKKKFFLKKNKNIFIKNDQKICTSKVINLYPKIDLDNAKKGDRVQIGFDDLELKVLKVKKTELLAKVTSEGYVDSNKGVHFEKEMKMKFLTDKDYECIKLAKSFGINKFALSFTNKPIDVLKFRKIIGHKSFLISKIETREALKNLDQIIKNSDAILIDRGDLSRYVKISKIPLIQLKILKKSIKNKKQAFVATNLLETMVTSKSPTRAESNDIFFSLLSGASGLVLAAETAIGKYPLECVDFIKECIKNHNTYFRHKR